MLSQNFTNIGCHKYNCFHNYGNCRHNYITILINDLWSKCELLLSNLIMNDLLNHTWSEIESCVKSVV